MNVLLDRAARAARHPASIVALAALAVRVVWLVLQYPTQITWDGAEYARSALNLLHGHGFTNIHGTAMVIYPPLYPLAIAALVPFTHAAEAAGVAVSMLAGSAVVFPVYATARRMYSPAAALIAAAVVAFLPFAVDMSTIVLSDAPFIFLSATAAYFLVCALQDASARAALFAGLFFGLAYLTRPEGLVLGAAGIGAGIVAFALLPQRRAALLRCAAVYCVALGLVATPYVAYLSGQAHALRIEGKSAINATIAARMRDGLDYVQAADAVDERLGIIGPEIDDDSYFADRWVRELPLGERIGLLAVDARRRLADVPRTLISRPYGSPLIALLAVVGLLAGPWDRRRAVAEIALLGYAAGLFLSLASVYHFWDRYAFGFVPLVAIWAGHGGAVLLGAARQRTAAPAAAAVLAAACVALLFSQRAWFRDNVNAGVPLSERAAGAWIASAGPDPGRILSVSDQSVYYAGGTWSMLPYTTRADVALEFVRAKSPHYLVLNRSLVDERTYVAQWLAHGVPDSHAQLVHVIGDPRDPDVAIYRWSGTAIASGIGTFAPNSMAR